LSALPLIGSLHSRHVFVSIVFAFNLLNKNHISSFPLHLLLWKLGVIQGGIFE